jgi:hypothetical protein
MDGAPKEMLPQCEVMFDQNTRDHDETKRYISDVKRDLMATMREHHAEQTRQFNDLDTHLRNGISEMLRSLHERTGSHGATIKALWILMVLVITGLLGVAWATLAP